MQSVLRRRREMAGRDAGTVTAEVAVVLPALVLLALGLVWLGMLAITQVRAVDAARETARAVARGDSAASAVSLGQRVATPGSSVSVGGSADLVKVEVASPVRAPGWLRALGAITLHASAQAQREPVP